MGNSMDIEVGTIIEGKVSGLTKFGAFVKLEDGTTARKQRISEKEYVSAFETYINV